MNSKRRPQWDDSLADRGQYRLTYAEQLQRKAAYVSKNKESAREELQKRQELLKQGKIPEEIKKTLRSPSVKQLSGHSKSQKNSVSIQKEPPAVSEPKIETHFAPLKKTQKASIEDHLDTLSKLDQAMKDLEAAMLKAANSEVREEAAEGKANEESISEGSLFGISDDEEFYQSKQSEKFKERTEKIGNEKGFAADCGYNKTHEKDKASEKAFARDFNYYKMPEKGRSAEKQLAEDFACEKREKNDKNQGFGKIFGGDYHVENFGRLGQGTNELEQTSKFCYQEEPIPYENVWADEDQSDLFKLVEQTRKDLSVMNISTNEDFEIFPTQPLPFKYDSDVVPQKFNLVPLDKPTIPRGGTSSLSIFDHVKNVQIDCRKFIIH